MAIFYNQYKPSQRIIDSLGTSYFEPTDIQGEEWKEITSWRQLVISHPYWISNLGRFKNADGLLIGGTINPDGYRCVTLSASGKCSVVQVHTLVATYFIGNPPKSMPGLTVNHIDHNKLNNNVSNLEWMSASDNSRDGQCNLCIRFIDEENKPEFLSCALASKHIGRQPQYIRNCINSHRPVRDLGNSIREIEIKHEDSTEWQQYVYKGIFRYIPCIIIDNSGVHRFTSEVDGSNYLNRQTDYLRSGRKSGCPRYNSEGEPILVLYPYLNDVPDSESELIQMYHALLSKSL